jgi:hypothetical protein
VLVPLAERATVRFLRATTVVARGMRKLPVVPLPAAERLALSAAASQLRVIAQSPVLRDAALLEGPRVSVEAALADLVFETLALVDAMLVESPTIDRDRAAHALPAAHAPPAAESHAKSDDTGSNANGPDVKSDPSLLQELKPDD